ncbi:DUF998 domain-containing protein [Thermococcus celer]|uniref:DUF998 domain-containing protein n=1 Tax=Thermococcus celer Vu 13 = JCM 8558 TaxID=1293037 RepID=A0A218P1B3_THECE|nr:DUF998 domain-containing protein [Thermococcus celer]ASI98726.1 hypothetical protein A3L02_03685 [Thermococcus celer Vu 13 = JCM 8558]
MDLTRLSAYVSLSFPIIFILGLAIVLSRNPWFSFTENALSDMGSIGNPVNHYFNGFLMILAILGFIAAVGALRNGLSYAMPLAMVFLFLVGVFPEEYAPHGPSAVLFYVLALADIAIVGVKLGARGLSVGYLWSVLAVVTFALMLYLVKARIFRGLAIPELVGAATIMAWFVYVGLLELRGFKP